MYNLDEMNNCFALTYITENKFKRQLLYRKCDNKNKQNHLDKKTNTYDFIKKHSDMNESKPEIIKEQNATHKTNKKLYSTHNNSYFWIIYVMIYGIEDYNLLAQKQYFSKEQEIRYILIDKIQKLSKQKTDFLKAHKIKPSTIISELGNSSPLSLDTFIGLCMMLNINVILVKNCIAQLLLNNENDKNAWQVNVNKTKIDKCENITKKYESCYYLVDNITKPFKAISAYKADELRSICEKVGIMTTNDKNKNKTKKDLYQELIDKIEI